MADNLQTGLMGVDNEMFWIKYSKIIESFNRSMVSTIQMEISEVEIMFRECNSVEDWSKALTLS